jgi:DNA-binding MarR family transcriptional regulator
MAARAMGMSCTEQLSRRDCTPVWLCYTTVVANDPLNDTELEPLLTQLLRLVNPAAARGPGLADHPRGTGKARATTAGPGGSSVAPDGEVSPDAGVAPDGEVASRGKVAGGAGTAGGAGAAGDAPGAGRAADGPPAVSASEARALIELVTARGIAQGELGSLLGLEKSTVSRLAAGLERKGWIRRGRDEGNQRYVRLYLTQEGRAVAAQLWQAWQSRQARILASLSPEERAGLTAGLRGLVRGLAAEGMLGDRPAPAGERGP